MSFTRLPPLAVREFTGGMMSHISDALRPANAARLLLNVGLDLLGALTQRAGTTLLGAAVSGTDDCHGLHHFVNSAGTTNRVVAAFNSNLFAYDGSTWTNVGSTSTTDKVRFANFTNLVFAVGGGSVTKTWTGNTGLSFTQGSQVTSAPSGKFIATYKQRVYIAGDSSLPDRLYRSSIVSSAGAITWTTSTDYIDINPEDGNNITGFGKIANLLLIFKERAMYRWNGSATDAEIVVDVGCSSQESVAQAKGRLFFFNPQGIWMTDGGYPQEISRPVYDWIKNMSASFYDDVSGYCDEDHYYCFIGNVTKGGRTFSNVKLVYTISSQTWVAYSYADSFRAFVKRTDTDGTVTYLGGDTDGSVQTLHSGTTDNGTPISYEYISGDFELDSGSTTKTLTEMSAYAINGTNTTLAVSGDDGVTFDTFGQLKDKVTVFTGKNVTGQAFQVKIEGINSQTAVSFEGFEFLKVLSMGVTRNAQN